MGLNHPASRIDSNRSELLARFVMPQSRNKDGTRDFRALFLQKCQAATHARNAQCPTHESSSANGGDRRLPYRPVRPWRGCREIDSFTIPQSKAAPVAIRHLGTTILTLTLAGTVLHTAIGHVPAICGESRCSLAITRAMREDALEPTATFAVERLSLSDMGTGNLYRLAAGSVQRRSTEGSDRHIFDLLRF